MTDLDGRIAALAAGSVDPWSRLVALVGACIDMAAEAREFWIVFVEFWGEMMHDAELAAVNAALYARLRRSIGAIVGEGVRRGRFRAVRAEEAGALILALVDGLSLQRTFDPRALSSARTKALVEEAIERYPSAGPEGVVSRAPATRNR
jgi:hypothetical protein